MKRLLLTTAAALLILAGCASMDEGTQTITENGFTITSKTKNTLNIKFGVTFGDGGCAGDLYYADASASRLNARIPTNGTMVEVVVDQPKVSDLRENRAFAPCFSDKSTNSGTPSIAPSR